MKNSKKEYITPGTTVIGVDAGSLLTQFSPNGEETIEGPTGAKPNMSYHNYWHEEEGNDEKGIIQSRHLWDE